MEKFGEEFDAMTVFGKEESAVIDSLPDREGDNFIEFVSLHCIALRTRVKIMLNFTKPYFFLPCVSLLFLLLSLLLFI